VPSGAPLPVDPSAINSRADAANDAIEQRRVDQGELQTGMISRAMGEQRIPVGDTVHPRRSDRPKGVENRAQLIVRGIPEEFVELVSVRYSDERRLL
jgi:exodeoxyribonuclease V alpha subunit